MAGNQSQACPVTAGADRLGGGAEAIRAFLAEIIFNHSIFERVEGDDCQFSARSKVRIQPVAGVPRLHPIPVDDTIRNAWKVRVAGWIRSLGPRVAD